MQAPAQTQVTPQFSLQATQPATPPQTRFATSQVAYRMPPNLLLGHAQEALILSVALSLPVVAAAAASQLQDPTLSHLPRLLAVVAALALFGPRMGREVGRFAERVLADASMQSGR